MFFLFVCEIWISLDSSLHCFLMDQFKIFLFFSVGNGERSSGSFLSFSVDQSISPYESVRFLPIFDERNNCFVFSISLAGRKNWFCQKPRDCILLLNLRFSNDLLLKNFEYDRSYSTFFSSFVLSASLKDKICMCT